jgi:hypothetical protein
MTDRATIEALRERDAEQFVRAALDHLGVVASEEQIISAARKAAKAVPPYGRQRQQVSLGRALLASPTRAESAQVAAEAGQDADAGGRDGEA